MFEIAFYDHLLKANNRKKGYQTENKDNQHFRIKKI